MAMQSILLAMLMLGAASSLQLGVRFRLAHRSPPARACANDEAAFDGASFFRQALEALPENPETAELQLRSGLRAALDAGERRVSLDIRVPSSTPSSRGFVPTLLARFALAAAQEAAVGSSPALTLLHSLDGSMQASLLVREREYDDAERPIVVSLGSPLAPSAEELAAHARPIVIVGPSGAEEHPLASGVRKGAAAEQALVLLNFEPSAGLLRRVMGAATRHAPAEFVSAFEMVLPHRHI